MQSLKKHWYWTCPEWVDILIENGYEKILHKQNQESQDRNNGKIHVVNTCILLIAEFDMKLIS